MAGDPSVIPKAVERPTSEKFYHQYWGKVGGVDRLRRTFSLFAEFREILDFHET
jgi:hypothetical protein